MIYCFLDIDVWCTNQEYPENYFNSFGDIPQIHTPSHIINEFPIQTPVKRQSSGKRTKKRSLFDSFTLRNSQQQYAIRSNNKSDSQAKLLEDNDTENMLFSADSIAPKDNKTDDEGITLIQTNGQTNHQVVVHFNKQIIDSSHN